MRSRCYQSDSAMWRYHNDIGVIIPIITDVSGCIPDLAILAMMNAYVYAIGFRLNIPIDCRN